MTLFVSEIVTAPTLLPITVDAADQALAAAAGHRAAGTTHPD